MLYYFNSQQISNIADENYRIERAGDNYAVGSLATDTITRKEQEFSYDANGNLIFTVKGKVKDNKLQATNTRKLLWDEENRLLAISDNGFVSNYWYDAAGERTVKESFDNEGVYVNGALSGARTGTTKYTAYISPYLVLNNGGNYTKHIYVGSQRIVSKWGNSSIFDAERPTDADAAMIKDFSKKYTLQTNNIKTRFDSLGVNFKGKVYSGMNANPESDALGQGTNALPFKYFYHPDHLGSSSLITDGNGYLVQNIQYVPFGEVFVEERNATWSTPYKFNGKEQDEETGLCYYGARYYDPRTSVWLSVDPLAEKYPNIGSYVYCMNNPVIYVDPDGRKWVSNQWSGVNWNSIMRKAYGFTHEYFQSNKSINVAITSLNYMYKNNSLFKKAWNDVKNNNETFKICEAAGDPKSGEKGFFNGPNRQITLLTGFDSETMFEEVYHGAQSIYYGTLDGSSYSKALNIEVEAKIAAEYSGASSVNSLLTPEITKYLNNIKAGKSNTEKEKNAVYGQLKSAAEQVVKDGYSDLKTGLENFDPATTLQYLESTLKQE